MLPDKVELLEMEVIHLHLLGAQLTLHKVAVDVEDLYQITLHHQELTTDRPEGLAEEAEEEAITLQTITLEDRLINRVYQTLDQMLMLVTQAV